MCVFPYSYEKFSNHQTYLSFVTIEKISFDRYTFSQFCIYSCRGSANASFLVISCCVRLVHSLCVQLGIVAVGVLLPLSLSSAVVSVWYIAFVFSLV